jgi:hypothetical protein
MSTNYNSASEKNFLPYSAENRNNQISSDEPQIRVRASDATDRSCPPLVTVESLVSDKPANTNQPISYFAVKEYHMQRARFSKDGTEHKPRYLANHTTVINSWVKHQLERKGLTFTDNQSDLLIIGDELGVNFSESLGEYLQNLKEKAYSLDTINDRKSVMWMVRESALELIKTSGLPESFNEALTALVRVSGKSIKRIAAEANICNRTLSFWMAGIRLPHRASVPAIEGLEDVFGLGRGTLTSRLIHLTFLYRAGHYETGTTPWRQHLRKLHGYDYRLKAFTPNLESEFSDLISFFTNDTWVANNDFERNSEWRIDPDGKIPTAAKIRIEMLSFMGHLLLTPSATNPWLKGMGMSLESLSLALMSDATLVLSHVEFKRERAYSQSYNNGTISFLNICTSWLRKGTGFLRQQPHYGAKLPNKVAPEDWDSWCAKNRQKILKFLKTIRKSKNRPVVMTRDPFSAVRQFIEELEHPISILLNMTETMKRQIPLLLKGNAVVLARHVRDIFFAEFITSYPLRIKNLSRMKFCLRVMDNSGPGLEGEDDVNLYQRSDGSWWIRYTKLEMKYGPAVDVPLAKSVVPMLKEYMFVHRPVLLKAIKEAINLRRAKFDMPPLNVEEERSIELNPYVFRQGLNFINGMNKEQLAEYTGAEPVQEQIMSRHMRRMSQRYIPNCKGFSAHAVRHLVASEYIKNRPDGYEAAAAALNDTVATVRKHYAWVSPCDRIKPWQDYYEDLRREVVGGSCPAVVTA